MIKVVYFIYLTVNWKDYLRKQLGIIKKCGLHRFADIYVSASSANPRNVEELKENSVEELRNIVGMEFPEIKLKNVYDRNLFEYPGIQTLYELGQEDDDSIILYYHSRGISRQENGWSILTNYTIESWYEIVNVFGNTDVDLIGIAPGSGCIWFNFMWVRSSYLKCCIPPKISLDRHYYEGYIVSNSSRKPITYSPVIGWDIVDANGAWRVFHHCTHNIISYGPVIELL